MLIQISDTDLGTHLARILASSRPDASDHVIRKSCLRNHQTRGWRRQRSGGLRSTISSQTISILQHFCLTKNMINIVIITWPSSVAYIHDTVQIIVDASSVHGSCGGVESVIPVRPVIPTCSCSSGSCLVRGGGRPGVQQTRLLKHKHNIN